MKERPIKAEERRFYAKVKTRLDRGMTWRAVADELKEPLHTVYNRYYRIELRLLRCAATETNL